MTGGLSLHVIFNQGLPAMIAVMGLGVVEFVIVGGIFLAVAAALLTTFLRRPSEITADDSAGKPLSWKMTFFSFQGRIPRRVYWGSNFLSMIIAYPSIALLTASGDWIDRLEGESVQLVMALFLVLLWLLFLAVLLWVAFAILAKRCHDLNVSGLWSLAAFVPLFGAIWATVVLGCVRGTKGPNRYGPDVT